MQRKMILAMAAMFTLAAQISQANSADLRLVGSGASFPFPIYSAWFKTFSKTTNGVTVDYQAKGSGAGIQDLINKTVDFAASDAAMTPPEIAKVADGVVLLPMTAGEIVLAYNLPGQPKNLKLPRDVYPDIFLGKITRWNNPRIAAANPRSNCRFANHRGPALRCERHDFCLHQAPCCNQPGVQRQSRTRHERPMAAER